MPLKKIVHEVAKNIAEKTAPDYVPPVPKPEPLTIADKHRLIRVKGNLDATAKKLAVIEDYLSTTNKEVRCKLDNFDLPSIVRQVKKIRDTLRAHIDTIDKSLKME